MSLFTFYKKAEPILKEMSLEEIKSMLAQSEKDMEEEYKKARYYENWKVKELKRHINILKKYINNVENAVNDEGLDVLVDTLKSQTTKQHDKFIESVKKYAERVYENNEEKSHWNKLDWIAYATNERHSDKMVDVVEYHSDAVGKVILVPNISPYTFYNEVRELIYKNGTTKSDIYNVQSDASMKLENKVKAFYRMYIRNDKKHEYIQKMVDDAEETYQKDINRLAVRIRSKGMNEKNLSVKEAWDGPNSIEAVVTDGDQTVYARSIFVDGYIQSPHYRYIIS